MVDPGVAGFAFGMVAGWSACFTMPRQLGGRAMLVPLVWLGWLVAVAVLAARTGVPVAALAAGAAAGAATHAMMLGAIAARSKRGAGR